MMEVEKMSVDGGSLNVPALGRFPPVSGGHRWRADAVKKCVPEGVATVLRCATETQRTAQHIHTSSEQVVRLRRGEGTTRTPVK